MSSATAPAIAAQQAGLAGPAAEFLRHMLGHKPLPRDDIERLGDSTQGGVSAKLRRLELRAVNKPENDDPSIIEPIELATDAA